jgi:hypothetical protein
VPAVAGDNDQYGSKDKSMSQTNFKKLDTNKDGKISQAEAAVDSTIVFSTADSNGDGYLDNDEWKASAEEWQQQAAVRFEPPASESSAPATSDPNMPQGTEPAGEPGSRH